MHINKMLTTLLTVLAFSIIGQAQSRCYDDWACIDTVKSNDEVAFWVSNLRSSPFTASLTVTLSHTGRINQQRQTYQETSVLGDKQRKLLLRITKPSGTERLRFKTTFDWIAGDMNAEHRPYAYLKPYPKDEHYRIVQGFGGGYSHSGASKYAVDFAMPVGTAVHAARGGVVVDKVEHHNIGGPSRRYARYANFIVIMHDDGTTGEYYHLKRQGVVVEIGQQVKPGQLIGYSGNTGFSSLPHLHFAVYRAKPFGEFESLPFKFAPR